MSITSMFDELGAALRNSRWSWGAVRETDKVVILRVWQDEVKKINTKRYVYVGDLLQHDKSLGAYERMEHINLIRSGYRAYMVMCEAIDETAAPRVLKDYNAKEVFAGGEVIEHEFGIWLEFLSRVPARSIEPRK